MPRLSPSFVAVLVLSLVHGTQFAVEARGTHERYDPYGYLAASPSTLPTATLSIAPTPISDPSPSVSISVSVSVSVEHARRKESSSSTSSPAPTSTSGISVVAIEPPLSKTTVPYIASTFFANWHALSPSDPSYQGSGTDSRTFGIQDLQWDLLDSVTYGYIPIPTSGFANISLPLSDATMIPQFVQLSQQNNVTSVLSFGGHIESSTTGGSESSGFALVMSTPQSITDFATGIASLAETLGVDGVEFDWEWTPCSADTPYNSAALSTAYLSFLTQLKAKLGRHVTLSLAVGVLPFETPNLATGDALPVDDTALTGGDGLSPGASLATTFAGDYKNVSAFADVVDYITVMNFDLYGAWSTTTGLVLPNSPLNVTCPSVPLSATSADGSPSLEALPISAFTSVGSWALSGFRNDQIILGVSSAGRSYRVKQTDALVTDDEFDGYGELIQYPPFLTSDITNLDSNATITDLGDEWWSDDTTNSTSTNATCSISNELSTISGVYTFQGLMDAGFLDEDGDVVSCIAEDDAEIIGGWDECSETPFMYNTKTGVMVSYDDSESMELKGEFVLTSGLRGFSLYEAGGDSSDAILLTALRHGADFPEQEDCLEPGQDDWEYAHPEDLPASDIDWSLVVQAAVDAFVASNVTVSSTVSTNVSSTVLLATAEPTPTTDTIDRRWQQWRRWAKDW